MKKVRKTQSNRIKSEDIIFYLTKYEGLIFRKYWVYSYIYISFPIILEYRFDALDRLLLRYASLNRLTLRLNAAQLLFTAKMTKCGFFGHRLAGG